MFNKIIIKFNLILYLMHRENDFSEVHIFMPHGDNTRPSVCHKRVFFAYEAFLATVCVA